MKRIIEVIKSIVKDKAKRTIASSIFSILLLVASVSLFSVSMSYSWLSINKQVNANDSSFQIDFDDTRAEYQLFKFDSKNDVGYSVDSEGNPLSVKNIDVDQYDMIFKHRNRYTPVVLRAKVIRKESMPKTGTVSFTITRNTEIEKLTDGIQSDYTSSIMRVSGMVDPFLYDKLDDEDLEADFNEADYIYRYVDDKMYSTVMAKTLNQSDADSKTFMVIGGTSEAYTFTKNDSLTISIEYSESQWRPGEEDGIEFEYIDVYLYISYDIPLMDVYTSTHNMSFEKLDENTTTFENDFSMIKISYQAR